MCCTINYVAIAVCYSSEEKSTTKTQITDEEISALSAVKQTNKKKILIKRKIWYKKIVISWQILPIKWRTYTTFTVSKER